MKVFYVTNMYPNMKGVPKKLSKYYGIHVMQQMEHFKSSYPEHETELFVINGAMGLVQYFKSIFTVPYSFYKSKSDVIHIHYGLSGLFLLFSPWLGRKTVVTFHGCDILMPSKKHFITKFISIVVAKLCKKNIYVSANMKKHLNENKSECIPCGVDSTVFFPCSNPPGINGRHIKLIFPGSPLREVKCYPLFQEVVNKLKNKGLHVETIILDGLSVNDVVASLEASSGILLTSLSEGSPQVIKEALLMNRFVFTVPVGDVVEYNDFHNVVISNTRNSEEISDLIIKNISNLKSCHGSRDKIIAKGLDSNSISKKLESLYKMLIGN